MICEELGVVCVDCIGVLVWFMVFSEFCMCICGFWVRGVYVIMDKRDYVID